MIRSILRAEADDGPERQPRSDTLQALAEVLETTVEWLMTGHGVEDIRQPMPDNASSLSDHVDAALNGVPFAGVAEAGTFRRVDLLADSTLGERWRRRVAVPKDPRFGLASQYAWRISGDSMDQVGIEDGMFVLGADYIDYLDQYGPVPQGAPVVVERTRYAGQEIEITCKEYRSEKGIVRLIPRSSNPKHDEIIVPIDHAADNGETTRILAVVVQAVRLFGQPFVEVEYAA